jgi:flagellar hook-length control protein FliK
MTPTPTLPVSPSSAPTQSTPSTTAAQTSAIPGDFMQLLAQLSGEPAQQATAAMLPGRLGFKDVEVMSEENASSEVLAALPISLPVLPAEMVSPAASGAPADALLAAGKTGASAISGQNQLELLTEMIQSELAANREASDAPDGFQLHSSSIDVVQTAKSSSAQEALNRPIQTPVGNAQWADEIGTRLTLMAEQGKHAASLRLSPEHLGPLEVRIAIQDDRASVWFGAAHADTRAAIEHALPRLRELFESQGMTLADAGVYKEAPRDQPNAQRAGMSDELDPLASNEPSSSHTRINLGLVDAYA